MMKAVGNFIFAGSASIGVMNTGLFEIDRIIEISDEIVEQNAKHFIHNFPDIPVVIPSEWDKEGYLESIKDVDLLYGNPPCSGLSQINRNASLEYASNDHFYRAFNNINKIKPKTFILENAPTTIKLGYPILKDMIHLLGDDYNFSIIKDQGGNHGVAMQRARTLIVGWRKDVFKRIPILEMAKQPRTVAKAVLDIAKTSNLNQELVPERHDKNLECFFKDIPVRCSIREHICINWNDYVDKLDDKTIKSFSTIKYKFDNNMNYWDKSPRRISEMDRFPSMSSVANFIHPTEDRPLTIREYATIMNYPTDFEFVEAKVPVVQAIAQGVPANFFQYIANEVGQALLGNRPSLPVSNKCVVFQDNVKKLYKPYDLDDIEESNCFEITNKDEKLQLLK